MSTEQTIKIPDIGGVAGVDVIEILVKVGDHITADTSVVTLESDKASMEIPASIAGQVTAILVKLGDKVAEGDAILTVNVTESQPVAAVPKQETVAQDSAVHTNDMPQISPPVVANTQPISQPEPILESSSATDLILASPSVRRFARSLGLNLRDITGSARNARIVREDVLAYVQQRMTKGDTNKVAAVNIDFSQFGAVETKPINKIKRLTGSHMHYSWTTIPHVTQFDYADITDLEALRKAEIARHANNGVKLTLLSFVCKVVSQALVVFPQFNSSLDASGEALIYKKYFNIGIAVETPQGLVVPVIKNIDKLSVYEIAKEMTRLSQKARDKGLTPAEMSGGCFTISSLGGIGGTAFTPVVNHPEVAILGLSRTSIQPVFVDGNFVPRLMLPLSLSYDHRVIDGAEGARFVRYLSESLHDLRRILL